MKTEKREPKYYSSLYLSTELLFKLVKERKEEGFFYTPRLLDSCYHIVSKNNHDNILLCDLKLDDVIDDIIEYYHENINNYNVFEYEFQTVHMNVLGFRPSYNHNERLSIHRELKNFSTKAICDGLIYNIILDYDTYKSYHVFETNFEKINVSKRSLGNLSDDILGSTQLGLCTVYDNLRDFMYELQIEDIDLFMKDEPSKDDIFFYMDCLERDELPYLYDRFDLTESEYESYEEAII